LLELNENTTSQNPCSIAKAVLRGKFTLMSAYTKKIIEISYDAPQSLRKTRTNECQN
jgi:hypothetical protein